MLPTATSQIIEQVIKLAFGLTLTRLFLPNIKMAVAGATLAITLSEIFALIYLIIQLLKSRNGTLNFSDSLLRYIKRPVLQF